LAPFARTIREEIKNEDESEHKGFRRENAETTRTDPPDRLGREVFDFSGRSRNVEPLAPGLLVPNDHQMNEKQSGAMRTASVATLGWKLVKLGTSWRDNGASSASVTCETTHKVVHDVGVVIIQLRFLCRSRKCGYWVSGVVTVDQSRRFTSTLRCGIQNDQGCSR
jgi:hypothetical protein